MTRLHILVPAVRIMISRNGVAGRKWTVAASVSMTGLGCRDEAREHHAEAASLPRTDSVEQAGDHHWQGSFFGVSQRQELVHQLGTGVAPARLLRWANEQVVFFTERRLLAFAIDF